MALSLRKENPMNNPESSTPPEQPKRALVKHRDIKLGQVVVTSNAAEQLSSSVMLLAIARHCSGDWGDVCKEDWELNDEALKIDDRLHSVYCAPDGVKFWIITEWDRSVTTILLPDDY